MSFAHFLEELGIAPIPRSTMPQPTINSSEAFRQAVFDFIIILKRVILEDDHNFPLARSIRRRLMKM
jgi:hypothetical protein